MLKNPTKNPSRVWSVQKICIEICTGKSEKPLNTRVLAFSKRVQVPFSAFRKTP